MEIHLALKISQKNVIKNFRKNFQKKISQKLSYRTKILKKRPKIWPVKNVENRVCQK